MSENILFSGSENFEYLWLNDIKDTLYGAIYYNERDPNSPQYVFSVNGGSYTGKLCRLQAFTFSSSNS